MHPPRLSLTTLTLTTFFLMVSSVVSPAAPAPAGDAATFVFFGANTRRPQGKAKGIYVSRLDTANGAISEPLLAAEAGNPTFLARHPRLPVIYAVESAPE